MLEQGLKPRAGDHDFVRAALATFTAMDVVRREKEWLREHPAGAIWFGLREVLATLKAAYPEVESVQRAALSLEATDEGKVIDSEIFGEYVLTVPTYGSLEDEDWSRFTEVAYRDLQSRAYRCAEAVILAADPSAKASEFPTLEDFSDVCAWAARTGYDTAAALRFVEDSDVLFGVDTGVALELKMARGLDATLTDEESLRAIPALRHFRTLSTYVQTQESSVKSQAPISDRAGGLREAFLSEVRLLRSTLLVCQQVFNALESLDEPERIVANLSDAAGRALLPVTRAIATEHMGYLFNRAAAKAATEDLAESFTLAAVASAHFAYQCSGNPRHAKYIAQNILETGISRGDESLRAWAEAIWVDAYVLPYHMGLHYSGAPAWTNLGWTTPIHMSSPTIRYEDIPPYSESPSYVVDGPVAEVLRGVDPSFPPDQWAAAVVLVQRFKDLEAAGQCAPYDSELPVYVPEVEGTARFPMLYQHPVAWFLFLADRLLSEHVHNRPHAGLVGSRNAEWDERSWLDGVVADYRRRVAGQPVRAARQPPRFPAWTRHLIRPAVEHWEATGREDLVRGWTGVVASWSEG